MTILQHISCFNAHAEASWKRQIDFGVVSFAYFKAVSSRKYEFWICSSVPHVSTFIFTIQTIFPAAIIPDNGKKLLGCS